MKQARSERGRQDLSPTGRLAALHAGIAIWLILWMAMGCNSRAQIIRDRSSMHDGKAGVKAGANSVRMALPGSETASAPCRLVYWGKDGKLEYAKDARGHTLPDFSWCGYGGGGVAIPEVPVVETLSPGQGREDDAARIQAALNRVGNRDLDADGFCGALLLRKGTYHVGDTLTIDKSGVVLRGEGQGPDGTVLIATAPKKYTVIVVRSADNPKPETDEENAREIVDDLVPVGERTVHLADASSLKVGDRVILHRPCTKEWLSLLRMDRLSKDYENAVRGKVRDWTPGGYHQRYERRIDAIEGSAVTLDVPVVHPLEKAYGASRIYRFSFSARIQQVGVEHLRIVSEFDRSKVKEDKETITEREIRNYTDEEHATLGISFTIVENAWARNVTALHLTSGAVSVGGGAAYVTVQDCAMIDAVSTFRGGRRYSFSNNGQMGLFLRCYSRNGRHDYSNGSRVVGPNAFVDCVAEHSKNASEPHHRYAIATLWDNVVGAAMFQAINRGNSGSGHGWAGVEMVFWNCGGGGFHDSTLIFVMQAPGGTRNYAIGYRGPFDEAESNYQDRLDWVAMRSLKRFQYQGVPVMGDGIIESPTAPVSPRSLYFAQLRDRLGEAAVRAVATPAQLQGTPFDEIKATLLVLK